MLLVFKCLTLTRKNNHFILETLGLKSTCHSILNFHTLQRGRLVQTLLFEGSDPTEWQRIQVVLYVSEVLNRFKSVKRFYIYMPFQVHLLQPIIEHVNYTSLGALLNNQALPKKNQKCGHSLGNCYFRAASIISQTQGNVNLSL